MTFIRHPTEGLTRQIIGAAIEVHRHLGAGLLESVYLRCLRSELQQRRLSVTAEMRIPVVYKGKVLDGSYVVDLAVNDCVLVEVKAVETVLEVHRFQLLTYLRLTGCEVGLLINFNVPVLKSGVRRVLNPLAPRSPE
jgi:GxxExxY protein